MKIKLLTALVMGTTLVSVGCNSGSRDSSSGSTTAPSTSSTTGPATSNPGPGGGGTAPTTGTFSNGPDMGAARGQHTATVLTDGRVLVTGGTDGQGILADSEVFDPLTNTWEVVRNLVQNPNDGLMMDPTDQFPTARQLHTATQLANGQVLIAGGLGVERMDPQGQPIFEALTTAYTFDATSNSFTRVGALPAARAWHVAGMVSTGGAVVAGGLDGTLTATGSADVFDATNNTFTQISMGDVHTWGAMVSLGNRAMIIGGANVSQGQQGFQINGFPTPRCEFFTGQPIAAAGAPDNAGDVIFLGANTGTVGNVFVAGGQGVQGQALATLDTTEVFDNAAGAWSAGPTLTTARFGAEVAEIGTTSDQLVIGGVDTNGQLINSCEVYGVLSNSILGTANMATPRSDFKAVTLNDGRIMVIGGLDDQGNGIIQTEFHTR